MIRRVLVLAFHLALLAGAAAAAERPKIGLVLAGGGAAGVAHVGVIRELERLGLRPDYVTGASMGAIVGGLYAAGYGPDDLERAVQDIDWLSILNDQNDRSIIHPLRRDSRIDPFSVQADLPVGVGAGGVQVAAGLVDGVRLTLILRELTAPALGIEDFDKLPIPFRAVATDLATGQPVVLGQGDLTMALRASMSIPALFPPVRIDNRLLVDGGVSNNLPIDVARAMGADVVIAVFIPPADVDPDRLGTLSASLAQTMSIFIHARSRELIATLGAQDVLITPDVGAVGMLDFAAAPDTVALGIAAAEAEGPRLAALAADRPTPSVRAPVGFGGDLTLRYDRLAIDYDGVLDPEVLRQRLDLPPSGEVTPARVQAAAERLYGLDLFQNVGYRLDKTPEGDVLVVDAQRKRLGAPLRFGLGLDTEFGGDSDFTLALGASLTELNPLGARIDVDGSIGQTEGLRVLFEQPLDYGQTWFFQGGATYVGRQTAFYSAPDNRSAEFRVNTGQFGGGFQFAPADWGRVGAGVSWRLQEISLTTGDRALLDQFDIDENLDEAPRLALSLDYDTLDDVDLPRTGRQVSVVLAVDPVGDAETDTSDVTVDALSAWSFGQHTVSPFFYASGELRANGLEPHFIGGFQRLSGFGEGELIGNVVGVGGLRYYRRFDFESPFGREAFAGGSLEYGGAWLDWGDIGQDGAYAASSLFAGVQTAFGPLILGFGFGETGQVSVTLGLGTRF